MNEAKEQTEVERRQRTMTVIWAAFLLSVLLYAPLTLVIRPPSALSREAGDNLTLLGVLVVMGASMVVLSFVMRRSMLAQAVAKRRPDLVQAAMIVALAFCETSVLFGLVALLATSNAYAFLPFLFGVAGMLLHRPRREHLYDALHGRRG